MTPQQVELVQTRFQKVVPIAGTAADLFYDRLFEIAPETRALFPPDISEQKKKLIAMLATAVTNLHKLDAILPAVKDLGQRQKGYGVTAAHYAPVGAALLWTLEKGLGPYCAAIFAAAGAKVRSISRRSFTAVSDSSIATSA
jgi:hemoglobin-like flavoprotein